jgi:hypothetical protein
MTRSTCCLALTALTLCPMTALAFGFRARAVPATAYYYYPAPLLVPAAPPVYAPVEAPLAPGCAPTGPGFAIPVPAPASGDLPPMPPATGSPAPPANAPKAGVSESSASPYSFSYYRRTPEQTSCTVAFWNYSSRDVTLTVGGQQRLLRAGKGITLDLPRSFTWRTDGRAEETEQVPGNVPGMEIKIWR